MSFTPSRRNFVKGSLAGAVALAAGSSLRAAEAPSPVTRRVSANEKINLAAVGCGGRGADDLNDLMVTNGVNVVALCDADERRAADSFNKFPDAKRYSDWRKLFDAEAKNIDAVLVATPDHNHAIVSIHAMKLGKHVYCEKPLAHSVWEVREMARVAKEMNVATQMGTQGHAYEGTRCAVEAIRSGAIGVVKEIHCWTDRPAGMWAQGIKRPAETPPVPAGLDWDVWLGPAAQRPYSPAYVPFKWRGFWDFGTGGIGDMGIHNLDTAFWALDLSAPTSVKFVDCSPRQDDPAFRDTYPSWSSVEMQLRSGIQKEPIKLVWSDGGKVPPKELFQGEPIPKQDGGSLVVGDKGTLFTLTWHGGQSAKDRFVLLPRKQFADYQLPTPTLPRVKSHHQEWVDACRGKGRTESNFGYASVLTETLLLGSVAIRTGKDFEWDPAKMQASIPEAAPLIRPTFREGWSF
jgi:predicted dehydrogenase